MKKYDFMKKESKTASKEQVDLFNLYAYAYSFNKYVLETKKR